MVEHFASAKVNIFNKSKFIFSYVKIYFYLCNRKAFNILKFCVLRRGSSLEIFRAFLFFWTFRFGDYNRDDIAYQDWCFIPKEYSLNPKQGATKLWRDELLLMGLNLFEKAFKDISKGIIKRKAQDKRFSTFEPDTNVKDVFKPDLLMIEYLQG